jgi:D-hexose-6-phosphate mutarotase
MLLKHIFRGSQKKQKTPPFLYYIPLKGFAKNTKWRLNKISKTGPAGHP